MKFDLAFAYEAAARSFAVLGNTEMMEKHLTLAKETSEAIAKENDKKYLLNELETIQ